MSHCWKSHLSYDFASGSKITLCNKICKPQVVYRFSGIVMTSITTCTHNDKIITFFYARNEISKYEGCSNMNASSFITFDTYMLQQNGIRFYKGLYVTFKLAPDLKTNTVYLSSYSPLNEGLLSILTNSMLWIYQWYRRAYNSSINRWNFLKFFTKYSHILI